MKTIAQGGFNTGRLYSASGQFIYHWTDDDGYTTFYDRTRMIVGTINTPEYPENVTPRWIMKHYDNGNYTPATQPARMPIDYDFGPALKI